MLSIASRGVVQARLRVTASAPGGASRWLSATARPVRREVSPQERAAIRAARKEQATQRLAQLGGATTGTASGVASSIKAPNMSRWMWYVAVGLPSAVLIWGASDENSPPAKLSRMIGLSDFVGSFTDSFAKPSFDKLLPDWSQMPNVPHDIPVPPTLVLDLENTLVSSTWDRKYGWRHAKRPGVDKFLHELAQYYEIVLYSPSIDGIADPVVTSLDKDGCILHRLYRDATYYHNGVHVKDLKRLNRNLNRMIVLDDDPEEVQFNPENLVRIKPYKDPSDRTDDSLLKILPFLVEIARVGYDNIPKLLEQYQGMDADQIADEQARRVEELRNSRIRRAQAGLGGLARGGLDLPEPELAPVGDTMSAYGTTQLTAKDIAGAAPPKEGTDAGFIGWMNRRAKEKEESQMRKLEKWNEVMMKKAKQRQQETEQK